MFFVFKTIAYILNINIAHMISILHPVVKKGQIVHEKTGGGVRGMCVYIYIYIHTYFTTVKQMG